MFKNALCLLAAAVTLFAGNSFHAPAVSAEADTQVKATLIIGAERQFSAVDS